VRVKPQSPLAIGPITAGCGRTTLVETKPSSFLSIPSPCRRRSSASRAKRHRSRPISVYSDKRMPQTVEISLRIPSLRVRREDTDTLETINNSDVRFCKCIEIESIPKPGVVLTMATSTGETFECEVLSSNWHHDKNMFVIACRYSKRSVTAAEHNALMNSSDWQVRALL